MIARRHIVSARVRQASVSILLLFLALSPLAICALTAFFPQAAVSAESCPRIDFGEFHLQPSKTTRPVRNGPGQIIHFDLNPITRREDIRQASLGSDQATILVSFKPDAAERTVKATTGRPGIRLAFVIDDVAVLAVVWEGEYGLTTAGVQISLQDGDEGRAREVVSTIVRCISD